MQYFRNTSRRMMDYQNPRTSDMFPLCRSDNEGRGGMAERQNNCGCSRNTENNRSERIGGCTDNSRSERTAEYMGNSRSERTGGCTDNSRCERTAEYMGNSRSERIGGRTDNSRCERAAGYTTNSRSERMNGCGCGESDQTLRCENASTAENYGCTGLAMAFVPEQEFTDLNDAEEALCRGTLFRQLDMPFYGQRRRNCK